MDDIPETYAIESIEQVRAMADELRIRIVDQLTLQPMTVTQVGEALGIAPNKAHYHVRELERVGLVRLVETREKGGILEKYYRAVAKNFQVPDELLNTSSPDELIAAVNEFIQVVNAGLLAAMRREMQQGTHGEEVIGMSTAAFWATNEEAKALDRQINALFEPYLKQRGVAGERERRIAHYSYTVSAPSGERAAAGPAGEPELKPKRRMVVVAGAVGYSRAELEKVVANNEQLDIRVFGFCTFADDIPASLVERAIARFRLRGQLHASDAVRAVLQLKEKA